MTAFLKIFDLLPGWVWAILLAGAVTVGCVEKTMHLNTKFALAQVKQERAEVTAQREAVTRKAETLRADINALRAGKAQEIQDALREDRRMSRAAAAADVPRRDKLRADTATVTAPSSDKGSGDPRALERAEATAAALGDLLESCDAVAERLGEDIEGLADQVRSLIDQYEMLSLRPGPTTFDPFADRPKVDPSTRLRWDRVMDTPQPNLASKPGANLGLRLTGVMPQVVPQGNPAAHHALDNP